jgi:hypothetical protein
MKRIIRTMTLADRLLLVLLLTASISGIFIVREALPESTDVVVEINGRTVYSAPLGIDKKVLLSGPCGEMEIEVRSGKVRIKDAHCPNKLCMKEGWISRGFIVCLPNKLVVFVGGRGSWPKKDLDAVTG